MRAGVIMLLGLSVFLAERPLAVRAQEAEGALVELTGTPEGATVIVDREALGAIPFAGTLAAGLHYFVVSAPGYYTDRRDVDVVAGEPQSLRFELQLDPALQPRGPDAPMIVGGSVVTLGGIAGIVLAIVGATGDRRCTARCSESGGLHVVERPAVDAIVAWSVAGGIALVVGAVLIGVGATSGGPARPGTVSLGGDGLRLVF